MTDERPARREADCAWELGKYMALRQEVVVAWAGGSVRGYVEHLAPTFAFALVWDGVDTIHVPMQLLPSVARAHMHDPRPAVAPRVRESLVPMVGQLAFDLNDVRLG